MTGQVVGNFVSVLKTTKVVGSKPKKISSKKLLTKPVPSDTVFFLILKKYVKQQVISSLLCCNLGNSHHPIDDRTIEEPDLLNFKINYERKTVDWGPKSEIEGVQYDLNIIRGVPQGPLLEPSAVSDLIKTFNTRDSDVFICTYVKSGTTWCQQIVHLLLNGGEIGSKSYAESIPWLEAATSPILSQWEATGHTISSIKEMPGPRYFKTHANVQDLPRGGANPKVIYVARNPKDVVVSLFHHAQDKPCFNFNGDFDQMLHFFMEGKSENGSWFKHVLDWYEESLTNNRVLFLKYEDMTADPMGHIQQIADFLEIYTYPELIQKVAEKSSLKFMKANMSNEEMKKAGINSHFRKGGSGGWIDRFCVRHNEAFDAAYRELMKGSGLRFDFGAGIVM